MKKEIFIHVGLPKTGSTALQQFLYENKDLLIEQNFCYPSAFLKTSPPKHQKIVKALLGRININLLSELNEIKQQSIIISSEGFTNHLYEMNIVQSKRVISQMNDYRITVVLMVRKYLDWLESYYSQAVFNPQIKGVGYYGTAALFHQFCNLEEVRQLTNINQLKYDLMKLFNTECLIEIPYSFNLIDDFCKAVGISITKEFVRNKHVNKSPPKWTVELMRQINKIKINEKQRNAWKALIQKMTLSTHGILNKASIENPKDLDYGFFIDKIKPSENGPFTIGSLEIEKLKIFVKELSL